MTAFVADPLFAFNQLTLLAGVGFAGGLYLFVRGFRLLSRKRLLLNTPTSKIRSASMGLVEVSGLATGPYVLHTPIALAPCFLYRTTVWQKNDDAKNNEWKKVAEECLHVPFFLDDGTGQLLIQPQGAELDLPTDLRQDFSDTIFAPHATSEVLSFLARHGVTPGDKIRVEECSIRPQNHLFIIGTVGENPGIEMRPVPSGSPGLRLSITPGFQSSPPPEIVRISDTQTEPTLTSQQSKIAAALTKAGIYSPAAWEAAGLSAEQIPDASAPRVSQISVNGFAPQPHAELSKFDLHPPVALIKGQNDPSFLISWRSQSALVRTLAWRSAAMIWGGAALALLALYTVLAQLEVL